MPTIVADLGGLELYSWVFSAYMLARAVSLPIFGKLCDLFSIRKLYIAAIVIFTASSVLAGMSRSMGEMIVFRAFQGIGAGGTFALAYIVLSDLYPPEIRGKMMGLVSFVWGISSILGPPIGGFIVAGFTWRWIFYINFPMGCLALLGIACCLTNTREKKKKTAIDFAGVVTLSLAVTALLAAFLVAGREYPWLSLQIGFLFATSLGAGALFCYAEKRAEEPILALEFFRKRQFSLANGSAFFSSFAIFSLSAFSPLFIQGVLGRDPAELGLAMVPLTLGWSVGAIICGQLVTAAREKWLSVLGSLFLTAGAGLALFFANPGMSLGTYSAFLATAGLGMGLVTVPTLLLVQKSLSPSDLGVATSSQQFARALGGTIGIGISGGLVATSMSSTLETIANAHLENLPAQLSGGSAMNFESLFQPQVQAMLSATMRESLRKSIGGSMEIVFWAALLASLVSLVFCFFFSGPKPKTVKDFEAEEA